MNSRVIKIQLDKDNVRRKTLLPLGMYWNPCTPPHMGCFHLAAVFPPHPIDKSTQTQSQFKPTFFPNRKREPETEREKVLSICVMVLKQIC